MDPDPEPEPDQDSLEIQDPDRDSLVFRVTMPYQISSVLPVPVLIQFLRIRLQEKSQKHKA